MIQSILKRLLSAKFQKSGVFETMMLTLLHWNKVSVKQLRQFLRLELPEED